MQILSQCAAKCNKGRQTGQEENFRIGGGQETSSGSSKQQGYFPYGCLNRVKMSLPGVVQAVSHNHVCSFASTWKDRSKMKEMVKFARNAMTTVPAAEIRIMDMTRLAEDPAEAGLSPGRQMKNRKARFVQGRISKDEYDARRRILPE